LFGWFFGWSCLVSLLWSRLLPLVGRDAREFLHSLSVAELGFDRTGQLVVEFRTTAIGLFDEAAPRMALKEEIKHEQISEPVADTRVLSGYGSLKVVPRFGLFWCKFDSVGH
jgi:hypothetical protein